MNILDEIIDYRTNEMIAGRNPTAIWLSDDQKDRLKRYIEESGLVMFPVPEPTGNEIMGMKIV
jgi:hypothetical protein